jgi:hypothetical protein
MPSLHHRNAFTFEILASYLKGIREVIYLNNYISPYLLIGSHHIIYLKLKWRTTAIHCLVLTILYCFSRIIFFQ